MTEKQGTAFDDRIENTIDQEWAQAAVEVMDSAEAALLWLQDHHLQPDPQAIATLAVAIVAQSNRLLAEEREQRKAELHRERPEWMRKLIRDGKMDAC